MQVHKHNEKATYWTVDGFIDLDPLLYTDLTSRPREVYHHSHANYSTYNNPPVIQPLLNILHSHMFGTFMERYIDIPKLTPAPQHKGLRGYHITNYHYPYLHPNLHSDIRFGIAVEVIVFLPVEGFTGGDIYFIDPISNHKQILENVPNRLVIIVNDDYNYKGVPRVSDTNLVALYSLDYLTFAQPHHTRPSPLYLPRTNDANRKQVLSSTAGSID